MSRPIPTISDHSRYSRAFLGQGIYGKEYDERCAAQAIGSARLLMAIRREKLASPKSATEREILTDLAFLDAAWEREVARAKPS